VPIYYPDILNERSPPRRFSYGDREVMLYALSLGMGADPLDRDELAFVYEKELKVIPTATTVLAEGAQAAPGAAVELPANHRRSQINYLMVLHGEQKIELHRPLPSSGAFTAEIRTTGAFDKGEKGALIVNETLWRDSAGAPVATLTSTTFARGDGGFGGPSEGAPEPHRVPSRRPDLTIELSTRRDQALLYRLNGDRNPLHSDPDVAARAGFARPILHGLCTYGLTCRAVLKAVADLDPDRILSHQARFSAPVFPGDSVAVDLWQDGRCVSFEARVPERDVTVIRNGLTVLR